MQDWFTSVRAKVCNTTSCCIARWWAHLLQRDEADGQGHHHHLQQVGRRPVAVALRAAVNDPHTGMSNHVTELAADKISAPALHAMLRITRQVMTAALNELKIVDRCGLHTLCTQNLQPHQEQQDGHVQPPHDGGGRRQQRHRWRLVVPERRRRACHTNTQSPLSMKPRQMLNKGLQSTCTAHGGAFAA